MAKHQRRWQRPLAAFDHGSLTNLYALQEEGGHGLQQAKPEDDKAFKKYFDYYSIYYRKKYGLPEKEQDLIEGQVKKAPNQALSIVGYDNSDSDDE